MRTYVIGDLQGCYQELLRLLDLLAFDPSSDQLWFVGDLVNRGPDSLAVLRYIKSLGERAVTVLGNHDLHLLALAAGNHKQAAKSTLDAVLNALDRDELLDWLRQRPLLHHDPSQNFTMVHAGLPPQWTLAQAQACAHEVEQVLRGADAHALLLSLYGDSPKRWNNKLHGIKRLRFIINSLTRLRYCRADGTLLLKEKSLLGTQPPESLPWFRVPKRRSAGERIVFGHWSTIGYLATDQVWALDSGCLWGGKLTALAIDDGTPHQVYAIDCSGYATPNTAPAAKR